MGKKKTAETKETESPSERALRILAKDIAKIPPDKIDFFLTCKKIKAEIDLRIEAFWARYNLSPGRFQVMLILRAEPGCALSPSALAERAGVARASMTQFLDALETAGYVSRQAVPGDRRATLIGITAGGLARLNDDILPAYMRRCARFSRHLSKGEMERFTEMYRLLADNMAKLDEEEPA